jgi:hypothetical protein
MSEKQPSIYYRDDTKRVMGDGPRLALAVIEYALSTGDRRFFESVDFQWWLHIAGIAIDDFRVRALLERVAMMPEQKHRPLTLSQRLQRANDGY